MNNKFNRWVWPSLLNKEQISEINKLARDNFFKKELFEEGAHDINGQMKKKSDVSYVMLEDMNGKLDNCINEAYHIHDIYFAYNLYRRNPLEHIFYNVYDSKNKSKYDWHIDKSEHDLTDIKLTLLINVSEEPYEGGVFSIRQTNINEIPEFSEPGSMIMFQSHIDHKVSPVITGVRKTITYFMKGPRFV